MKSKGFIKILEAIIASIILLGSVSYFFSTYIKPSSWSDVMLEIQARDTLITLDKAGYLRKFIQENNFSGIENYTKQMLPETVNFYFEIDGLPKNKIKIGCNCTDGEIERLREMLHINASEDKIVVLKDRQIEFGIEQVSLDEVASTTNDIILFFGYKNLTNYESYIEKFFDNDKALVVIGNLSEAETNEYSKFFNLSWQAGSPNNDNKFNDLMSPKNISFHTANYFVAMPIRIMTTVDKGDEREGYFWIQDGIHNLTTGYNQTAGFDYIRHDNNPTQYKINDTFEVNSWFIKVVKIDSNYSIDNRTYADITIVNRDYEFNIANNPNKNSISSNEKTILKTSNSYSSVQTNYQITKYGNGRTVWFKDYPETQSDINQLFKSVLLWAAGERYIINEKQLPKYYTKVNYLVSGNTEFEPYFINLVLWYIF